MKTLRNIIVISVLLVAVLGYFGSKAYKTRYAAPRKKIAAEKARLEQSSTFGTNQVEMMRKTCEANQILFTRSLPLNPTSARTDYQLWLTQLAEFCDMQDPVVRVGAYQQGAGIASHQFQLQAECTMEQLYRFLYEFYWTGYLHRINSADIQSVEGAELLRVALVVEGLTMAKLNPNAAFPTVSELPLAWSDQSSLASGPFAAYEPFAKLNIFRYSQPGIDEASYTVLTGLPTVTGGDGKSETRSQWKIESQGKTITRAVGETLQIGSFDGQIESIAGDMVTLLDTKGFRWILILGDRLSDAVAVPFAVPH